MLPGPTASLTAGTRAQLALPNGRWVGAALFNLSPFNVTVSYSAGGRVLAPWTADLFALPSSAPVIVLDPESPGGTITAGAPDLMVTTLYDEHDPVPAGYPISLAANALAAVVSGLVTNQPQRDSLGSFLYTISGTRQFPGVQPWHQCVQLVADNDGLAIARVEVRAGSASGPLMWSGLMQGGQGPPLSNVLVPVDSDVSGAINIRVTYLGTGAGGGWTLHVSGLASPGLLQVEALPGQRIATQPATATHATKDNVTGNGQGGSSGPGNGLAFYLYSWSAYCPGSGAFEVELIADSQPIDVIGLAAGQLPGGDGHWLGGYQCQAWDYNVVLGAPTTNVNVYATYRVAPAT
jgi:hypothetical protein